MPEPEDLSSLLELDGPPAEQTPPPAKPEDGDGTPKPTEADKKFTALEESNKNLQEQVRQVTEANKTLSDFRDKLIGNTDDDKKKKEKQELLKRFDENPLGVIEEIVNKSLHPTKEGLALETQTNVTARVMANLDKNYDVDWDKDYQKIITHLKSFKQDAKDEDPEGTLISACKLAGVIKKKEGPTPPHVVKTGRGGEVIPEGKTEEDVVNERLNKYVSKKSNNVFGIQTK